MSAQIRDDFLKTLDVVRTASLMDSEAWRVAFNRLRQYQVGWRRTQVPYVVGAIVICSLASVGLGQLLPLIGISREGVWGAGLVLVLAGVVVAQQFAWMTFEQSTGISKSEFNDAEVLLDRLGQISKAPR